MYSNRVTSMSCHTVHRLVCKKIKQGARGIPKFEWKV